MKKLPILFIVVALFCSSASAQERREREKPTRDREKTAKQKERKAYGYGAGEIKIANPADWIKNIAFHKIERDELEMVFAVRIECFTKP